MEPPDEDFTDSKHRKLKKKIIIGDDLNMVTRGSPGLQVAVETQQVAMCAAVKVQQASDQC